MIDIAPSRNMTDPSGAPRVRLFTTWGTVLYVDAGSGELRHGAVDHSPANAVFIADPISTGAPHQGWITHDSGERMEAIVCLPDHSWSASSAAIGGMPAASTPFELVPLERGLMGLRSGGLYLCAEPSGQITLSRSTCSLWECFLASEDWCAAPLSDDRARDRSSTAATIDRKQIARCVISPLLRNKVSAKSKTTKLLFYGFTQWSHGRVYYDLCKSFHKKGYIADILDWRVNHASYIGDLIAFYDFFITALDATPTLAEIYGVPWQKIIALSHSEMDVHALIGQKGLEYFANFAGYGVVSYPLFTKSVVLGVPRHPLVVPLGVNFAEFYADIPERLATVGYASEVSHVTAFGVEIRRGELAEACAREAGLEFKVAIANPVSFHDMPEFYRSIDAVLITSVTEGGPLPVLEGAAAGRLVIGTPVGHFPLRAYQGGGIIAPIESEKFKKFTTDALRYYKENPSAYVEKCRMIQEAARKFDWEHTIGEWIELIETAREHRSGVSGRV